MHLAGVPTPESQQKTTEKMYKKSYFWKNAAKKQKKLNKQKKKHHPTSFHLNQLNYPTFFGTKFPSWALGKTTEDWHEDHACQATPEDKGLSHWWLLWCAGGLRRKDEKIWWEEMIYQGRGFFEYYYFHIRVNICMSYIYIYIHVFRIAIMTILCVYIHVQYTCLHIYIRLW